MITIPIKVTLLGIFIFSGVTVFIIWKLLKWAAKEDQKQYEIQLFDKIERGMTVPEIERICNVKAKWICTCYDYHMGKKNSTSLYVFSTYCFCFSCMFWGLE